MKAIAQRRDTTTVETLTGTVLCHDVRDAAGKIVGSKGARLDAASASAVLAAPWDEVHLLAMEPGDLHEEEAGGRLARAVIGEGVEVKGYTGGQWTLAATPRGLLFIPREALGAGKGPGGGSGFTPFHRQPRQPGATGG